MTNAVYTINFWDGRDVDPIRATSLDEVKSDIREIMSTDANAAYFVIKSTHGEAHEDITAGVYSAVANAEVDATSDLEDVPDWAKDCYNYEERVSGADLAFRMYGAE